MSCAEVVPCDLFRVFSIGYGGEVAIAGPGDHDPQFEGCH